MEADGLKGAKARWNLSSPALYEEAVRRGEGLIAAHGPLVCRTGQHTGRSPNDKFIVESFQEPPVPNARVITDKRISAIALNA